MKYAPLDAVVAGFGFTCSWWIFYDATHVAGWRHEVGLVLSVLCLAAACLAAWLALYEVLCEPDDRERLVCLRFSLVLALLGAFVALMQCGKGSFKPGDIGAWVVACAAVACLISALSLLAEPPRCLVPRDAPPPDPFAEGTAPSAEVGGFTPRDPSSAGTVQSLLARQARARGGERFDDLNESLKQLKNTPPPPEAAPADGRFV